MKIKRITVGELETNCYLLVSEKKLLIIDPGGEPGKILKEIKKTGAVPKYIVNTHYHSDHTLANEDIKEKTGARVLNDLRDNGKIKIGKIVLRVIHTPGHSKESICLLSEKFIFTGDTLFENGHGRTDLAGGSREEIEKSLARLSEMIKPGMIIYPGHGKAFKA